MIRLLLLAVLAFGASAAEPVTVIFVRHAERAGAMADGVDLSDAGKCRAGILARMLADANLKHIYTSDVARTQQTAAPIAKHLTLEPDAIPGTDYDRWAATLRAVKPGEKVLVIGHSNTIPEIIGRLGGSIPAIGDKEFDRMWIVTLSGANPPSIVTLHYAGCVN